MKATNKQSQKIGGLVTREVSFGVDGPLTVQLKDNIILVDDSGNKVTVPAIRVLTALTFDPSGILTELHDLKAAL
jgi:hypothetical protein